MIPALKMLHELNAELSDGYEAVREDEMRRSAWFGGSQVVALGVVALSGVVVAGASAASLSGARSGIRADQNPGQSRDRRPLEGRARKSVLITPLGSAGQRCRARTGRTLPFRERWSQWWRGLPAGDRH
jgi:hypothetical protein